MNLRSCLIALTLISAVCDTMLLPFYPQFFELEFNTSSPQHVGLYIAACCVTVMICFPLWARLARRGGGAAYLAGHSGHICRAGDTVLLRNQPVTVLAVFANDAGI